MKSGDYFTIFVAMENRFDRNMWRENVVLVDADYVDSVAFDLIVNFERMLGRRIPPADFARWIDCIALDGGLREGTHETQVVLLHSDDKTALQNFLPSAYDSELNGMAFKDHLGEFSIQACSTNGMGNHEDFLVDLAAAVSQSINVKRLMIVPNEATYDRVRNVLRQVHTEEPRVTLFAMQPMSGGRFFQEILGYSLMNALGIKSEELNNIQ